MKARCFRKVYSEINYHKATGGKALALNQKNG
jgi:hypothetical protein